MSASTTAKIAVLCGGYSAEREVSLRSGTAVHRALERLGYTARLVDTASDAWSPEGIDAAVIMLHGNGGEDGSIQAYLESFNIPYLGSDASSSALAMNKWYSKEVFKAKGIPTAKAQLLNAPKHSMSYPMIVKPIANGSSVGVEILKSEADWQTWIDAHQDNYRQYFVEEYIEGQEITVSLLEKNGEIENLPILELRSKTAFYDYHAKYTEGMTTFVCPAELDAETEALAYDYAARSFLGLGCRHMGRVDMMVHGKRGPFVLEVNTLPGFTELSDLPAQAKTAGYSFDEVIQKLVQDLVPQR